MEQIHTLQCLCLATGRQYTPLICLRCSGCRFEEWSVLQWRDAPAGGWRGRKLCLQPGSAHWHRHSAHCCTVSTMRSTAAAARRLRLRLSALCARVQPAARTGPELGRGALQLSRRNLNVQTTSEAGRLKSIDDLSGPSMSTTLYWLFVKGYADKRHLLQVGAASC